MKLVYSFVLIGVIFVSCKNKTADSTSHIPADAATSSTEVTLDYNSQPFMVYPISHASMVLDWKGKTLYVDPVGAIGFYEAYPDPDLILITDIHGDHLSVETLEGLNTSKAKIMVPQAVADKLPERFTPQIDVLNNGESKERFGFEITAIPMYNLREEALKFHTKGRGNGYVIEDSDQKRVYISGDTEDIPEMRTLKDIDVAFVCMNLPYTMTVERAADAVATFAPKEVYPYHYRGTKGLSDIDAFADALQSKNADVRINRLDWYPIPN